MRLAAFLTFLIFAQFLVISGCGGGGGDKTNGESKTKQATIKFYYLNNTSPRTQFGGFDMSITLPDGASIDVDNNGKPLSSVVYLSGIFKTSLNAIVGANYDNLTLIQKKLTITAGNLSSQADTQGEFLTVICNVPLNYIPNIDDVVFTNQPSFTAPAPTFENISQIIVTKSFN